MQPAYWPDSPEFQQAVKLVIKQEIQFLLQRLATAGEETLVLTASLEDGSLGHLGSGMGDKFATARHLDIIKSDFLSFCKELCTENETESSSFSHDQCNRVLDCSKNRPGFRGQGQTCPLRSSTSIGGWTEKVVLKQEPAEDLTEMLNGNTGLEKQNERVFTDQDHQLYVSEIQDQHITDNIEKVNHLVSMETGPQQPSTANQTVTDKDGRVVWHQVTSSPDTSGHSSDFSPCQGVMNSIGNDKTSASSVQPTDLSTRKMVKRNTNKCSNSQGKTANIGITDKSFKQKEKRMCDIDSEERPSFSSQSEMNSEIPTTLQCHVTCVDTEIPAENDKLVDPEKNSIKHESGNIFVNEISDALSTGKTVAKQTTTVRLPLDVNNQTTEEPFPWNDKYSFNDISSQAERNFENSVAEHKNFEPVTGKGSTDSKVSKRKQTPSSYSQQIKRRTINREFVGNISEVDTEVINLVDDIDSEGIEIDQSPNGLKTSSGNRHPANKHMPAMLNTGQSASEIRSPINNQKDFNLMDESVQSVSGHSYSFSTVYKKDGIKSVCQLCQRPVNRCNYRSHWQSHLGRKPFQCSTCGHSFSMLSNLKQHALTHTNIRPYQCPYCSKNFRRGSHLKGHILALHRHEHFLFEQGHK